MPAGALVVATNGNDSNPGTTAAPLRSLGRAVAVALAGVLGAGLAVAPANAATSEPGQRSLAAGLTSDGNQFDKNWYDYDIVTEAVLAVLAAKPGSPVGVLADGSVALTAFIPNDRR